MIVTNWAGVVMVLLITHGLAIMISFVAGYENLKDSMTKESGGFLASRASRGSQETPPIRRNRVNKQTWTVWVGGSEITQRCVTVEEARITKEHWVSMGYTDTQIVNLEPTKQTEEE